MADEARPQPGLPEDSMNSENSEAEDESVDSTEDSEVHGAMQAVSKLRGSLYHPGSLASLRES